MHFSDGREDVRHPSMDVTIDVVLGSKGIAHFILE